MQRPTSVLVFAILNLFFGVMGVVGTLMSLMMFALPADAMNPMAQIMQDYPNYRIFMKITTPIGILASLILVGSAIGLWYLKEWGRKLSLGYGIYTIIMSIIGPVINFLYLMEPMLKSLKLPAGTPNFLVPMMVGSMIVGAVVALAHGALMIYFLTRPKVVAAFRPTPAALPA